MQNQIKFLVTLLFSVFIVGCGAEKKNDPNHIVVGIMSGPEYQIAEAAKKVAEEKYKLNVELVSFNDYVMPNEALQQGDIDVNAFQNKPYLDIQAKQRGYKLAIVGNTFVYPLAGYSKKIKKLDELKEGNTIVIPNDPTNSARALLLMQQADIIQLRNGVGLFPTLADVTANPKNIRILEMEAPQLPRALDDRDVTIAVINATFSTPIGLNALRDGIFVEDKSSPYVNNIVAREDNKNEEKVKKFVQAYQSPEVEQAAIKAFDGGAIKGW
ncbi:methionine ABC transporter substrate-binding lipoprotein MetQ [Adhaeribacter radiodurans]|uniref:Lipoprotein n=1 Tax=Adhaeribacter radiodurans TaxID=2745197 RepID=A0A7L7LDB6_9BACT|nr:methionine ABC transporter substrate-binding lipoprotein MetQ [Adhaeribacter radiodurans]QMU30389.1 methionine ABC transporter substrate-binding lipoprotein MetQ [Adhaeribacter radiodurans]